EWLQMGPEFTIFWRQAAASQRQDRLVESAPFMPKARGVPYSLSNDAVHGVADLCPELNLLELKQAPEALLQLIERRCHQDMVVQRMVQDGDFDVARSLSEKGKFGRGTGGKSFYLRDPVTTDVSGPHHSQREGGSEKFWHSDLIVKSEIWETVLLRQQTIFSTLYIMLKNHENLLNADVNATASDGLELLDDSVESFVSYWLISTSFLFGSVAIGALVLWRCPRITALVLFAVPEDHSAEELCSRARQAATQGGASREPFVREATPSPAGALVPPPDLCCPISSEIFTDPVLAADGETYERWYIESWIREKQNASSRARRRHGILSPMGHGRLSHTNLVVNQTVRRLANQWREERGLPQG
ncbi:unnamed protein product, partial [Polarella glacialis]